MAELREMDTREFTTWAALITVIEPYEKQQAQKQQQGY